jgi:transposase InsO family protein
VLRRPIESAQYLSIHYTERLALAGIEPSVGSVGESYDNALAETINGLYKAEVIHRLGPRKTMASVEWETLKWPYGPSRQIDTQSPAGQRMQASPTGL